MQRRRASSAIERGRKLGTFKSELILFFSYCDWHVTFALILSLVADFVAFLLFLLEPFFAFGQDYEEAFSFDGILTYITFLLIATFSILIIRLGNLKLFKGQIMILWLHTLGIYLIPFMIWRMRKCNPDIQNQHSPKYLKLYVPYPNGNEETESEHCPDQIYNCYMIYFKIAKKTMAISLMTSLLHSGLFGCLSWRRVSTSTSASISASPPPPITKYDNEPDKVDEGGYKGDVSSSPSLDQNIPTKEATGQLQKLMKQHKHLKPKLSTTSEES